MESLKIYFLCDMEGVSGLMSTKYMDSRYEEGRALMTKDISASVAAALDAGADEVCVCDCHGGGDNVIWEDMYCDERVTYESLAAGKLMPSLESTFAGVVLLGHHAKAGTPNAFTPHTMNGATLDVTINGQSVGEIGIETCYAGAFDVPLVMVQGDEACCAEATSQFPGIVTACVKRGLSSSRVSGPHPAVARRRTADRVREAVALARDGSLEPFKPTLPMEIVVTGVQPNVIEGISVDPAIERIDSRSYRVIVHDQRDVWRWNRW